MSTGAAGEHQGEEEGHEHGADEVGDDLRDGEQDLHAQPQPVGAFVARAEEPRPERTRPQQSTL